MKDIFLPARYMVVKLWFIEGKSKQHKAAVN